MRSFSYGEHAFAICTNFRRCVFMALEAHGKLRRHPQPLLEPTADFHDATAMVRVGSPDTNFVATGTHIDDSPTHLVRVLIEGLAHHAQKHLQPVPVQVLGLLVHAQQPAPTVLVGVVLPHGPHALLEQGVIAAGAQLARVSDVVVQAPEVLHRREAGDFTLVLLPGLLAIVLVVPQGPRIVQRVLDEHFAGQVVSLGLLLLLLVNLVNLVRLIPSHHYAINNVKQSVKLALVPRA